MAAKVTNQQILDTLAKLGYNLPGSFDARGAQHGDFKNRVMLALESLAGDKNVTDIFDQAEGTAVKLQAIPANLSPQEKLAATLSAFGVQGHEMNLILQEAQHLRSTQPGIYEAGSKFTPEQYAQAVTNVLGTTGPVSAAFDAAGVQRTQPAPGSQGAKVTPPPAATDFSGVGNADAMPVTAKPTPVGGAAPAPASKPAPAPGAGAAAGAGMAGGAPSNQPPPPATWNDDQIKTFIKQNFGSNAYFVDIPEVWDKLKEVVKSGKGVAGLEPALETTQFWLQNGVNARAWYVAERKDPAQTAADVVKQTEAITNQAQAAGITLDPVRAQQMAQSYLRYGWTQTDLQRAIGAEWHYDPATKNQAAAVTKMKTDAQSWLVPLSDDAIQTWGQGLISGTTTQEAFTQYLRDNAKSLMPQLSTLIDQHAGDPKFSVSTFADPYKQHAANLLGLQPDQIDLNDSKWRKALDTVDPKTGERRIMSLGEWESTIKTDPTYGYDKSANGIQDGLQLAGAIKTGMGF